MIFYNLMYTKRDRKITCRDQTGGNRCRRGVKVEERSPLWRNGKSCQSLLIFGRVSWEVLEDRGCRGPYIKTFSWKV